MAYKNVLVDETPCNILPGGIAGEAITAGDLVYLDSDGAWQLADAVTNTATTRKDALGVAWKDAQANEFMSPVRIARIRDTTASLTIGQKIYLSDTAGAYSTTEPTTNIRQVVGVAIKSDEILFAIGGASGAPIDVGGDMNADSLTLVSTLSVGSNASITGTLSVTSLATFNSTLAVAGAFTASSTSQFNGDVTLADEVDLIANTNTGTKIGTATNQKFGFFNATPVAQQTAGAAAVTTSPDQASNNWGFTTSTQAEALIALANANRTVLVNLGLAA